MTQFLVQPMTCWILPTHCAVCQIQSMSDIFSVKWVGHCHKRLRIIVRVFYIKNKCSDVLFKRRRFYSPCFVHPSPLFPAYYYLYFYSHFWLLLKRFIWDQGLVFDMFKFRLGCWLFCLKTVTLARRVLSDIPRLPLLHVPPTFMGSWYSHCGVKIVV